MTQLSGHPLGARKDNFVMKKSVLLYILVTIIFLAQSCKDKSVEPEIPSDIAVFVQSQNLPKVQPIKIFLEIQQENLIAFKVSYGEAQDCQSGCFYSIAYGLKVRTKIGWLRINDYDQNDLSHVINYDFDSTETILFSNPFWDQLNAADYWVYRYAFLPLLVSDKDVPTNVLQRIAEGLYTYIDSYLASLLLLNSKVQESRTILTLLAELPVFQGDAYQEVRGKARELLNSLGNG